MKNLNAEKGLRKQNEGIRKNQRGSKYLKTKELQKGFKR